jgi:hypothetical protein
MSLVGIFGQMFAVQRHYISYAELLKIRYSNFPCLVMVGTEDRLVRETNSYMLRRVCSRSPVNKKSICDLI